MRKSDLRRHGGLASLFAALLIGCGPSTSTDDATSAPTSDDWSCDEYDVEIEVSAEDYEEVLGMDGTLSDEACLELCQQQGNSAIDCSVIDDGIEGGSSSGGDDSGGTAGTTQGVPPQAMSATLLCVVEDVCGVGGRGHQALRSDGRIEGGNPLARWLASMAHAEAASVTAFLAVARELAAHGAPADLVARARGAAGDEVRHARAMAELAGAHGVEPLRPDFGTTEIRDLLSIAIENAVEGCVRETWAALEASYQAKAAEDPRIRAAMATIAVDETRHAELALAIDGWLRGKLDATSWAKVEQARSAAAAELCDSIGMGPEGSFRRAAGLPPATIARQLQSGLRGALWGQQAVGVDATAP